MAKRAPRLRTVFTPNPATVANDVRDPIEEWRERAARAPVTRRTRRDYTDQLTLIDDVT